MQAFRPLQRYFDFSGRSGRAEYWQFLGIYLVALTLAFAFDYKREVEAGSDVPILMLIVILGAFIPSQAVAARRLHDRGKSAKWLIGLWIGNLIASALGGVISAAPYSDAVPVLRIIMIVGTGVSIVCAIYLLVQACLPGDDYRNRYGEPDTVPDGANPLQSIGSKLSAATAANRSVHPAPTMDEALAAIERLGRLKEQGLVTEEEFTAQKARLLNPGN